MFDKAWIRIPNIIVENLKHEFLNIIKVKIRKAVSTDRTGTTMERGKFTCLSVEVDVSKPLLLKTKVLYVLNVNKWVIGMSVDPLILQG